MNWPGLQINFNRNTKHFNVAVLDHRETENIPINSASGTFDMSSVNIFDNNFHTLMCSWATNDNYSIPNATNSISSLQKTILAFDGLHKTNENVSWLGKKTPLNFSYDDFGKSTFLAIGGELQNQQSSSSLSNFLEVAKMLNGIIKEMIVWDCVLTSNAENLSDDQPVGTLWQNYTNGEDPLTGSTLKSYSSNVVAYYKFTEELAASLTAKDYAGSNNGGAQTNPVAGNTLNLFNSFFNNSSVYTITDTSLVIQDNIHFSGELQFLDENNIKRKIGKIFYEFGIIVFDNEYNNSSSGLPIFSSLATSGMSFSSTSSGNFIISSINFTNTEIIKRATFNLVSSGDMMNYTENPTGFNQESGKQLLNENAGYITAVGLYNDNNELLAVGKLNKPIRKDIDHNVNVNVRLDF